MATPEKLPELPSVFVAALETAHENRQLEIFMRLEQRAQRASRLRPLSSCVKEN
jgi:hypothetical protein